MKSHVECDILIVGGGAGGTAAALAASDAGAFVCLLEETKWLGGQLTSQGVCTPDEQKYIETFGGTRRYMAFRHAIRNYYSSEYTLAHNLRDKEDLQNSFNPGSCWVSRISFEPKIAAALLRVMTQPFEEYGRLKLYFGARATSCEMDADDPGRIAHVVAVLSDGSEARFTPRFVLDATDLGDLLPMCGEQGIDWVVGAESASETGEPDAPAETKAHWVQPFTFPFAIDWSPETADTNVIERPYDYDELKACQKYHVKQGAITGLFSGAMPWWSYRRVLATANFEDPRVPSDVTMINTAGNDYYGGNVIGTSEAEVLETSQLPPGSQGKRETSETFDAETLARARRASLGYLYWLQTECERESADVAAAPTSTINSPERGYPEFRLRKDLFDTDDGCSPRPYIRESRRIRSLRPILEQEIVVKDFSGNVCRGDSARAEFMPDSVGIGHYALDIHPNGHGEPNHYVATRPFQIPLGAFVPVRLNNLLPACKNPGVTHLTNGAYRLHPIEWNIGESAGSLAAWCLAHSCSPRDVYDQKHLLLEFQETLIAEGIALHWYVDVPDNHGAFKAVQWLAGTGATLGTDTDSDLFFHPDDFITEEAWMGWQQVCNAAVCPALIITRAEAAMALWVEHALPS